jgi:hypothetical protein
MFVTELALLALLATAALILLKEGSTARWATESGNAAATASTNHNNQVKTMH